MNSEQLQNWLTDISEQFRKFEERVVKLSAEEKTKLSYYYQRQLLELGLETRVLINYLENNYENVQLIQPLIAQILSIYFKLGELLIYVFILILYIYFMFQVLEGISSFNLFLH